MTHPGVDSDRGSAARLAEFFESDPRLEDVSPALVKAGSGLGIARSRGINPCGAFASDIFVNLSTMPPWLQAFVSRNPGTHLANASRKLMHGQAALADVAWVPAAATLIVLVTSPIAMRLYRKER